MECPCGFVGENCTETGFVENGAIVLRELTSVPGGICGNGLASRAVACIAEDDAAVCVCESGWTGELCNQPVIENLQVLILGGIVAPTLCVILALVFCVRKPRVLGAPNKTEHFGSGRVSQLLLFLLRLVVFLFHFGSAIYSAFEPGRGFVFHLRFFTVCTFYLAMVYSLFALVCSMRALRYGEPKSPGFFEKASSGLLQVALPASILVLFLSWTIVYPYLVAENLGFTFINYTSFASHGGSTLLLLIEYLASHMRIYDTSFPLFMLYASLYILWHSTILLVDRENGYPHRPAYNFISSEDYTFFLWPELFLIAVFRAALRVLAIFDDRYKLFLDHAGEEDDEKCSTRTDSSASLDSDDGDDVAVVV